VSILFSAEWWVAGLSRADTDRADDFLVVSSIRKAKRQNQPLHSQDRGKVVPHKGENCLLGGESLGALWGGQSFANPRMRDIRRLRDKKTVAAEVLRWVDDDVQYGKGHTRRGKDTRKVRTRTRSND